MAWGDNGSGQWGNGIAMNGSAAPVQMRGVSSLTTVAAVGNPRTLAKLDNGVAAGTAEHTVREVVAGHSGSAAADRHAAGIMVTAAATQLARH
jgi:hypothetical protein